MIDRYFKAPIFWDYSLAIISSGIAFFLHWKNLIHLPKEEYIFSISSDLSNISLTISGFILTLLTVLITFKSTTSVSKRSNPEDNSLFELFFASDLYFQTVGHLKNCIKSLIFIAVIGYVLKLSLLSRYLYFYNIVGVIIITLTLWRSLLILTRIIKIQESN